MLYTSEKYRTFVKLVVKAISKDMTAPDINLETGQILSFTISGFSKSGTVKVVYHPDNDTIVAYARYNETRELYDYNDLVLYAWEWYQRYKDRGYTISEYWVDDFIAANLIKSVVTTIYVETQPPNKPKGY